MGVGPNRNYIFDNDLLMKDAGAISADAAAQVGGSDKIIDLGLAYVEGDIVIDVNAIDFVTGDEAYLIKLQLSASSTFASGNRDRVVLIKGDAAPGADTDQTAIGRMTLPFNNEIEGTVFRFARLFTDVAGTTPSIDYEAFMAKSN